jgi:flagellar hook-length control protein FliK
MQTSPLNIWGLQPAEVTPNATVKAEAGFEGILDQALPTGETMTAGILGETGLEAGSNGPIALDQELDQATESQTSSDLIALMMAGLPAPQASDAEVASLANLAVVNMVSAPAEADPSDLLAKKEVRLEAPARGENAPAVETASLTGIELPEGFKVADQPVAFEGEIPEVGSAQTKAESPAVSLPAAKSAQTEEVMVPAAEPKTAGTAAGTRATEAEVIETITSQAPRTAVEAALPEEKLPFVKTNDPIGQLLNERWQAWVKQNYAGPLAVQTPAPLMPAAMNTAFSAAAQTGQISLAQAAVKPVLAAAPVYSAVVTTTEGDSTEGAMEGEAVEAPTSTQANPNLGGAFSSAVRSAFKPLAGQNEAFVQTEATTFEEELTEVVETEAGSAGQTTELTSEQTRLQGKDQVQTQSQPLTLTEENSVAKQASKTLQDMIEAHQAKTMTIRMNPEELGSLTIKVRQFGRRVEAEVSASLDSVRQALTNQKQELAAAVENRGAQLTNLVIKSESTATDSQTNNSFSQNGNSGDGRTHQEAQQEANRFARLTAANAPVSETQPERTQVRTGRTSRFDLTA